MQKNMFHIFCGVLFRFLAVLCPPLLFGVIFIVLESRLHSMKGYLHMRLTHRVGLALAPLTVLALTAARPVKAQVLIFEGLRDNQSVGNYYNGGLSGNGVGPGPNYGVSFTPNALSIISRDDGGTGNFSRTAPPSGDTILVFLSGNAATLNVAAGFNTGFSFYYSAIFQPGFINVYSGLNDTGTLLATLKLPTTPNPVGLFQPFVPTGVAFSGTAKSIDFGGTENQIGFDNITFGQASPIPEASTTVSLGLLLCLGLGGMVMSARRRKAQSAE